MPPDRAPRVSVVIPTHNRAALVCEAIDSALAQTYRDFEVLVVDDGSTDATAAVLPARFGGDPRVHLVRQENRGAAAAQNTGVRLARGEFIALLGDDDLWRPEKLARQVAALDRHPDAALCFSDLVVAGGTDDGRRCFEIAGFDGTITVEALVRGNFIPAAATLIRRSCLLGAGAFDETLRLAEDWDLWIRLLAAHPAVCVDRVVGVYRRHDGPQLCDDRAGLHDCIVRVLRKNRGLILKAAGIPDGGGRRMDLVERAIRRHAAIHYGRRAKDLLVRDPGASRAAILPLAARAIRQEPWRPKHYRRFLVLAVLGPRIAARWYGRRARAPGHVPAAAAPAPHPTR